MTKHAHSEMIKAKADNMELVVFIKMGNSEWMETSEIPTCEGFKYFLCLPQHKEACLHWLNGGVAEQWCNTIWLALDSYVEDPAWHKDGDFMDSEFKVRIKPRKQKRWIVAKPSALVSMMYFNSKQDADDAVATSTGEFKGGQVIEIEVGI